jgi:hypothetical protein
MSSVFKAALASERDVFNQKFAEVRRRHPDLDGEVFGGILRTLAAPIVENAAAAEASAALAVTHAVYDAALTLAGERLAGPGGRYPVIDRLWESVLPRLGSLVADQPVRVIGSLTNAVVNVASTPGARAADFVERLGAVVGDLRSVEDLLRAGEVAAWRAGLAHLRESALAAARSLAFGLASSILGAPRSDWSELSDALARDPWLDPGAPQVVSPRLAAIVGGFRGFGGMFLSPPRVFTVDDHLLATDGQECWFLTADAFGATFHRADGSALRRAKAHSEKCPVEVPILGRVTSAAAIHRTIALTGSASHGIALVAVA